MAFLFNLERSAFTLDIERRGCVAFNTSLNNITEKRTRLRFMAVRWWLGFLVCFSGAGLANEWEASVTTVLAGESRKHFSSDMSGFYATRLFSGGPLQEITYGPNGDDYVTNEYLTDFYFSIHLAGASDVIAFVVEGFPPTNRNARVFVNARGEKRRFVTDNGLQDFASTKTYTGPVKLSRDGGVVANGAYFCGPSCKGRVDVWKLNSAGAYEQVVNDKLISDDDEIARKGYDIAVSASRVASIDYPRSDETLVTTVDFYDLVDGQLLTGPSDSLTLAKAQFGEHDSQFGMSMSDDGDVVAITMKPTRDYPATPSAYGGVAVFRNISTCVLACGWVQKGQTIDPSASLAAYADWALDPPRLSVALSANGDSLALLNPADCYDDEDDLITPCSEGIITVWDFDAPSVKWVERQGDSLPIVLPLIDPDSQMTRIKFNESAGLIGTTLGRQDYGNSAQSLVRVSLEEVSTGGLPIWLLWRASQ